MYNQFNMAQQKNTSVSHRLRQRALLVQRGGVRAAVLGVNDGLVSTLCLVVAVAAAGADTRAVVTAGFAGLLAGAISMAAGEWISVKAQVELFQGVLDDLRQEVKENKTELVHSLAHALAGRGMNIKVAHQAATDISQNDEHFIALYSAQVIGMNKDELGSPWHAAFSSFLLFALGSLAPIIPWLFINEHKAVVVSIIVTSLASLIVGGFIAKSSGKNISYGAFRQLLIVLASSIITYGIGYLFGVATS
jgi:VIT1/CCC1 family predicted Fe2+/Mn2+ transporter